MYAKKSNLIILGALLLSNIAVAWSASLGDVVGRTGPAGNLVAHPDDKMMDSDAADFNADLDLVVGDLMYPGASAYNANLVYRYLTGRPMYRDLGTPNYYAYKPYTKPAADTEYLKAAAKRSPMCLRKCMSQGFLHPAQCHSLC